MWKTLANMLPHITQCVKKIIWIDCIVAFCPYPCVWHFLPFQVSIICFTWPVSPPYFCLPPSILAQGPTTASAITSAGAIAIAYHHECSSKLECERRRNCYRLRAQAQTLMPARLITPRLGLKPCHAHAHDWAATCMQLTIAPTTALLQRTRMYSHCILRVF